MIRPCPALGLLAPIACLGAIGCSGRSAETAAVCTEAEVHTAVVSALTFGRAEGDVAPGFDLDGHDSLQGDAEGCGHEDYTSPDGQPGVDNAFAGLMPILETTEAQALEPIIEQAIQEGLIVLLLEMTDPHASSDSCRSVRVLKGEGQPLVGTDGEILPGQTLEVDDSIEASEPAPAILREDGSFYAEDIRFDLPIQIFDADLLLHVEGATLSLQEREDGSYEATLGGHFPYANVVDGLLETNIDQALKDLLPTVMGSAADIDTDGDLECENLSVTLELEALPAYTYSD